MKASNHSATKSCWLHEEKFWEKVEWQKMCMLGKYHSFIHVFMHLFCKALGIQE